MLFQIRVTANANVTEKRTAAAVADALLNVDLSGHTITVLSCSTAMIPKRTSEALNDEAGELHRELVYEPWSSYGWIIAVDDEGIYPAIEGHDELLALLRFAHDRGFGYLQLDCDEEPLPEACGLPTFSW